LPGLAGPTVESVRFVTTDPQRAHEFLSLAYADNTMTLRDAPPGARMEHFAYSSQAYSVASMVHTMSVEHIAEPSDYLFVGRLLAGRTRRDVAGRSDTFGPGDSCIIATPGQAYSTEWSLARLQLARVERFAIESVADDLGLERDGDIEFTDLAPVPAADAAHWGRTLDFLVNEVLPDNDAMASPLLRASALRQLISALLATFGNTAIGGRCTKPAPVTDSSPRILRRAMEYIDGNAHLDIDLRDIAAAANVTPRSIQLAFRTHLDRTPLQHLRRVRLAHAHHDLVQADPGTGATVTAIAARWGFLKPSTFALYYRDCYGVTPSATLHA
jgi:AraC-like DNA-binding protein